MSFVQYLKFFGWLLRCLGDRLVWLVDRCCGDTLSAYGCHAGELGPGISTFDMGNDWPVCIGDIGKGELLIVGYLQTNAASFPLKMRYCAIMGLVRLKREILFYPVHLPLV